MSVTQDTGIKISGMAKQDIYKKAKESLFIIFVVTIVSCRIKMKVTMCFVDKNDVKGR